MFIIPDLGELLHEIDEDKELSPLESKQLKEKAVEVNSEIQKCLQSILEEIRFAY